MTSLCEEVERGILAWNPGFPCPGLCDLKQVS